MKLAEQLAAWADKLRDLSALGLHFGENIYDRERYTAVQDVAMEMFALASGESLGQLEPLRVPVLSRPTPFIGADAAIIDDAARILLIRRSDNGKWAMPGGALEVGETPAEGVAREVLEETGMYCRAEALVGVFDSRRCRAVSRHHLYVLTFLCRPIDGAKIITPSYANEVLDVRWFAGDGLPDDIHPGNLPRITEAFRLWRDDGGAFFDQ